MSIKKFDILVKAASDEALTEGIGKYVKPIARTVTSPLAWAKGAAAVAKGAGHIAGTLNAPDLQKVLSKPTDIVSAAERGYKSAKKWLKDPNYLKDKEKWWEGDTQTMDSQNKLPAKGNVVEATTGNSQVMKFKIISKSKSGTNIIYKLKPLSSNKFNIIGINLSLTNNDRGKFITRAYTRGSAEPKINSGAYLEPAGIKGGWLLKF